MPKHKTVNEDIIDLLKHGSYDYLELVEYAESQGHDKFHNFEFGYRNRDSALYTGNIKLFPFFSYEMYFLLSSDDNKSTKVMLANGTKSFTSLKYFSPDLIRDKRITKITCRNHFVSRVKAWDKFVESSKHKFLENAEKYMNQLGNFDIDNINLNLDSYNFGYNVSMESMIKDYELFKLTLDENIECIKQFKSTFDEDQLSVEEAFGG